MVGYGGVWPWGGMGASGMGVWAIGLVLRPIEASKASIKAN